jgi:hypothetical protein
MAGFGDVLQDAFVSNDADITASSGDGEEDGEEDGASSVEEKKKRSIRIWIRATRSVPTRTYRKRTPR